MKESNVRYVGAQIDAELHRSIKMKCTELGLEIKTAVVEGLCMRLGIELPKNEEEELKEETA